MLALTLAGATPPRAEAQPASTPEPKAPATGTPAETPPTPGTPDAPAPASVFVGKPEVVAEGFQFVEGPTWVPAGKAEPGFLIFCEYPSKTVYRTPAAASPNDLDPPTHSAFREDSGGAVGSAVDAQWRFYFAEAGTRRITRLEMGENGWGKPVVLCDAWDQQPLNDTNDLCVSPSGHVYFTDPTFFNRGKWKQPHKGLYRVAPDGKVTLECQDLKLPNGVAITPDGKTLYVNEFGEQKVMAFDVGADGSLGAPRVFADLKSFNKGKRGGADGLKVDASGRVFTTGPGGIYCLSPEGALLDFVGVAGCSNVAIGGDDGKTLFITAGGRVMKVGLK